MSKPKKTAKPAPREPHGEEVILHVAVTTYSGGHNMEMLLRNKVMADLGLEHDPKFTDDEMQRITRAAKREAIGILFARERRR